MQTDLLEERLKFHGDDRVELHRRQQTIVERQTRQRAIRLRLPLQLRQRLYITQGCRMRRAISIMNSSSSVADRLTCNGAISLLMNAAAMPEIDFCSRS